MGVWLPLALADLATLMFATIRMWAAKPDEVKVPKRSELLKGWALPFTASALVADEVEMEREKFREFVDSLKAKSEAGK